jgi:SAM-dependent methyltransferase
MICVEVSVMPNTDTASSAHHHPDVPAMSQHHAQQDQHHPDHDFDPAELMTQAFWDARYSTSDRIWSGNPNQRLVEQVADLAPGSALDLGCGEGGDAIWLAAQGWRVTAIDVSPVALARAARQAAEVGTDVAGRITWEQADMLTWDPAPRQFDLISAHFIHLPPTPRQALHRRLAAAVSPGGTLLIVGHHPSDMESAAQRWHLPEFFYTPEQVAAVLDPAVWRIDVAAAQARTATDPEGQSITIHDAVLRATRRA